MTSISDYRIETERTEYNGQPSFHTKTMITKEGGYVRFDDVYWDSRKKDTLGGYFTITSNGVTTRTTLAPYHRMTGGTEFAECIQIVFRGTEAVTVPYGSYPAAGKFEKSFSISATDIITETDWMVPGIAPPVKTLQVRNSDPGWYAMDEQVAWG